MTNEKKYLIEVAEKTCIPALEKAINNFLGNKPYLIIDHTSFECTKLEELLRPLWGIAPLLEKKSYTITVCGEKRDLAEAIRSVILEGSRETSPNCFSRFAANRQEDTYANQMITEFAGYCLALVLAPNALWTPYSEEDRKSLAAWIEKWAICALKRSWRNNHFWFPMLAVCALEKIGIDCGDVEADIADGFSVLDTMYISDGWYQDGEFGRFDFYLSWSHHVYPLLWSFLSEGTRFYDADRAATYKKRTAEFFDYYTHMFDVDGSVPAFGRSLSYRFAQSSYFAAAAFTNCDINYGMARRILIKNVSYFMDNMIPTDDGVLPPGYLYTSPAIVENYTSSGGAYWCAKTFLILALPDDHPFWTAPDEEMPSEKGEFIINSPVENINMVLENSRAAGVTLYNNTSRYYNFNYGYCGLFNDMAAMYTKFLYNSRAGFGLASADVMSADNTICLQTWDALMASRRCAVIDEGIKDGFLVSHHTPFSNDKDSVIKSWVLPLGDGFHVRAHKVTLANEYNVIEGGMSVGNYDDGSVIDVTPDYIAYSDNKSRYSKMHTVSDAPFNYSIRYHMPGLHLLAPTSGYPSYTTEILAPGTYRFASVFFYTTEEKDVEMPVISLDGNVLTVNYKDKTWQAVLD